MEKMCDHSVIIHRMCYNMRCDFLEKVLVDRQMNTDNDNNKLKTNKRTILIIAASVLGVAALVVLSIFL